MAKVLITGAAGFLGQHLLRTLAGEHELVGVDLTATPEAVQIPWIQLAEPAALAQTLYAQEPEFVVHGAFNRPPANPLAQAYLGEMLTTNLPLFDAAAETGAKLLLLSSSAVYGRALRREIIDEACPREPVSLYGIAKTNQELFATYAAEDSGLQLPYCASSTWPPAGTFVDARDVARAIGLLIADFQLGSTVNVASGRATSLTTIIEQLAELCPCVFDVQQTRMELSSSDVFRQRGSFERLNENWGWAPQIPFEQSLADLWMEWVDCYNFE